MKKSTFVDDHRFQRLQHRTHGREESPLRAESSLREESSLRAGECFSRIMTNVTSNQLPVQTESGTQQARGSQTDPVQTHDVAQQTNLFIHVEAIKQQPSLNVSMIEGNNKVTKFYTGLPTWAVFLHVFMFLSPFATDVCSVLSLENQMLLALTRLRLNLLYEDLAVRFGVSIGTVSSIFDAWLNIAYIRLGWLIVWPKKEIVLHNAPNVFKHHYPNCRVIIDCSEVLIETPLNLDARAKTYSNYKNHNTVKFLIGVTPNGSISFLSKCWGGRVSDKIITQCSGFLQLLEQGDIILADRGFTISDDIALFGAKLKIPAFTRGKTQLTQKEVETSQQLSRVRIHVERVIGLMKNKFTILKGPIPVRY